MAVWTLVSPGRRAGQLYCTCSTYGTTASVTTAPAIQWTPLSFATTGTAATLTYANPWTVMVTSGGYYDYSSWNNLAPPTPEQAAAQRHEYEERQARRARVTERAEELLLSLLTPLQAYSYRERGWFEVTGSAGGRFRINRRGQAGNVDELPAEGDKRIASWCIHPYGGFPDADAHATQYLALVTDEPGFRAAGNRTPRRQLPAGMAA